MEFFERLRKKPQHIRNRFALGGALSVTALIALIWSTTIPARFGEIGGAIGEGMEQTSAVQSGLDAAIQNIQAGVAVPEKETAAEVPDTGVEELEIHSMAGLQNWQANTDTTLEEEKSPAPAPIEKEELSTPEPTPQAEPQEKVILIGTTTKKSQ